jgi:hypothetical protein
MSAPKSDAQQIGLPHGHYFRPTSDAFSKAWVLCRADGVVLSDGWAWGQAVAFAVSMNLDGVSVNLDAARIKELEARVAELEAQNQWQPYDKKRFLGDFEQFVTCERTQRDFAEKHYISPQYVSDIMKGNRNCPDHILKAMGYERAVCVHPLPAPPVAANDNAPAEKVA